LLHLLRGDGLRGGKLVRDGRFLDGKRFYARLRIRLLGNRQLGRHDIYWRRRHLDFGDRFAPLAASNYCGARPALYALLRDHLRHALDVELRAQFRDRLFVQRRHGAPKLDTHRGRPLDDLAAIDPQLLR